VAHKEGSGTRLAQRGIRARPGGLAGPVGSLVRLAYCTEKNVSHLDLNYKIETKVWKLIWWQNKLEKIPRKL
jgi:hypothetical protein